MYPASLTLPWFSHFRRDWMYLAIVAGLVLLGFSPAWADEPVAAPATTAPAAEAKPAEAAPPTPPPAETAPAAATPAEKPAEATAPPAEATPPAAAPAAVPPTAPPAETPAPAAAPPAPTAPVAAEKKEPSLRFNFRFQAWVDVLEWFAKQADLALVLDAPVPGTFNYTDSNEYTPTEAIDLMNGVLLSKGYALIRRDRMLMVVNLQGGVPEGMVPRVSVEELNRRGRFELVSVLLPLGRRNVEEVNKEITPLLGQYGKSVPLAKTNQLLVTDTAGILQAVEAMIKSMPEPPEQKPAAQPKPEQKQPPAQPVLAVYPLKSADSKTAVEVLKALLPDDKIALDSKSEQINVYALPDRQAVVKAVVEQMQAEISPEKRPRLEAYQVDRRGGRQLQQLIAEIVPGVQLSTDPKSGKMVAWATPDDHAKISAALEKLRGRSSPGASVQIEVHRLTSAEPAAALALLQQLLPDVQLAVDAENRSIVAIALPDEQAAIRAALAELQGGGEAAGERRLENYSLDKPATPPLVAGLRQLAPAANIILDPSGLRLTVVASDKDHEIIKHSLDGMKEPAQLLFYPLERSPSPGAIAGLQQLAPDAKITLESGGKRLMVVAAAADQAKVAAAIQRLGENETDKVLRFYEFMQVPPESVLSALRQLVPDAQVTLEGKRLTVVAGEAEHEQIRSTIEGIESALPAAERKILKTYPATTAEKARFNAVLPTLQAEMPGVTVLPDGEPGVLAIWASPSQHALLADVIARLKSDVPDEQKQCFAGYQLSSADPQVVLTTLQGIFPDAKLSIDPKTRRLLAWCSPEQQKQIAAAVKQMDAGVPDDAQDQLMVYPVTEVNPAIAIQVLGQILPGVQLYHDAAAGTVIARARKSDQEIIAQTLKAMQAAEDIGEKLQLEIYASGSSDANLAVQTLKTIAPKANLVADQERGRISAWATPKDHEKLREAVKKLAQEESQETAPSVAAYRLGGLSPWSVLQMLRSIAPRAQVGVSPDSRKVVVWARPQDQKRIAETFEKMQKDGSGEEAAKVVVYQLESTPPQTAVQMISQAAPEAIVSVGADPRQLVVWALPADHEKVKSVVDQLGKSSPAEKMVVYDLEKVSVPAAIEIIRQAVPQVRLAAGATPNKLVAWAKPADHEKIAAAIAEISKEESPETAAILKTYTLETAAPAAVIPVLTQVVPQARVTQGADPQQLIVFARPDDHKKVEEAIEQLSKSEAAQPALALKVYTIEATAAGSIIPILQRAAPQARITVGSDPSQLIVHARPSDHEVIAAAVEELAKSENGKTASTVAVYKVNSRYPYQMVNSLQSIIPTARFTVGAEPGQIVAWARAKDHEKIKQIIDKVGKSTAGKMVVYTVESTPVQNLLQMLSAAVPRAQLSVGDEPHKLIAWADDVDHAIIKAAIEELAKSENGETASKAAVYKVDAASPYQLLGSLQTMVPTARFTLGADPGQIVAWAKPSDHEKIKEIIAEIGEKQPGKMVVYTLNSTRANSLLLTLREVVPRAKVSVGSDPQKLFAWASDEDQAIIKAAVDEIEKGESGESASRAVVYKLGGLSAYQAMYGLREIAPNARFTMGAEPNQLIAWARPEDHAKIKAVVDEMSKKQPAKMVVFTLESTTADAAIRLLTSAFPDARFAVGTDPRQLVAWVNDDDAKRLDEAVNKLSQDQLGEDAPTAAVYTLKAGSFAEAMESLRRAVPEAKLILGSDPRQLTAWARPGDQKKIADIVAQMDAAGLPETRVYFFRTAEPRAAMSVLQSLVPTARMALNEQNRSVAVSALAADHEKIKKAVEEIDREDAAVGALRLQAHQIRSADPQKLFEMLRTFFRNQPEIQLSLDAENETVMALAAPRDHDKISSLIEEVERGNTSEFAPKVEVYSLKNVDPQSLEDVLGKLLQKDMAKVQLSVDARSEQLVAIARPKHQEIIRETVERMRTEEPLLEIYQLDTVDPKTAELAVQRLFDSGGYGYGYGYDPNAPTVDIDEDTQQLFVSATKEQHDKIRELLEKMGETNLKTADAEKKRTIRVVPFRGDARATIEEIRRVWPQLRDNPIEIIGTESDAQVDAETIATEPDNKESENTEQDKKEPEPKEPEKKDDTEKEPDKSAGRAGLSRSVFRLVAMENPAPEQQAADAQAADQPAAEMQTEKAAKNNPVVLILGDNSITVKSDDPAALEQMESLLRSLSPSAAYGRNMDVFPLQHTDAVRVANQLQESLRDMRPRWERFQNQALILADERTNSIIVKASRADRTTIENMVRIFDAPDSPQAAESNRPTLINVHNTEAARIEQVVREVFHAQLSGAERQGRRTGSGRWSPRISVDAMSNSLIVVADPTLMSQIQDLVQTLDSAAGDESARGLKIISLKKANASRVEQALDAAVQRAMRRGR